MNKTREEMIAEARRIRAEIAQIFVDCDHWNRHTRKPHEPPIDPDPDGELQRIALGIDVMLREEDRRVS